MPIKNLNQPIKNFDGTLIKLNDKDITFKSLIIDALMSNFPDEKLDGVEKLKRYKLASKIFSSDEVELSTEEIVEIKQVAAKGLVTIAVGQIYEYLEQ